MSEHRTLNSEPAALHAHRTRCSCCTPGTAWRCPCSWRRRSRAPGSCTCACCSGGPRRRSRPARMRPTPTTRTSCPLHERTRSERGACQRSASTRLASTAERTDRAACQVARGALGLERAAGAAGADGGGDLRAGAGGLAAEDRVIRWPGPVAHARQRPRARPAGARTRRHVRPRGPLPCAAHEHFASTLFAASLCA